MTGYDVQAVDLRIAGKRIEAAAALADRIDVDGAVPTTSVFGNRDLGTAVREFCTVWELAVQALQGRSRQAGRGLAENAAAYEARETEGAARFRGGKP